MEPETFMGLALILVFLVALAAGLIPEIFFLLNLQNTLRRVRQENRRMVPGYVWLILIPLVGLGWFIYVVVKVADSLRAEYETRGWPAAGDFGYGVGLAAGILNIAAVVWQWLPGQVEYLWWALMAGWLVCWIIYWVKIARIKSRLGPERAWGGQVPPPYNGYGPPPGPGGWPAPGGPPISPDDEAEGEDGDDSLQDESTRCPVCGTAVRPDDKYCWHCGVQIR